MVKKYLETLYGMGEKALQALIIIVIGYIVYKIFDKLFTKFIEKSSQDEIVLNFFKTIHQDSLYCDYCDYGSITAWY